MKENNRPMPAIGVMIFKGDKILLGKRVGSHGAGEYCFPGGHLEYMEGLEQCALREIREECGIEVKNLTFDLISNVTCYAPKHYVYIGFVATWNKGEPQILEPEKCESWNWYDLHNLPEPLFKTTKISITNYKQGKVFFDS